MKKPRFTVGQKVWVPAFVVHDNMTAGFIAVGRHGLWLAYKPRELRRRK